MFDKSLSARIPAYKMALESGELQRTYQDLVSIVQSLRTEIHKRYKGQFTVANVLHGYIDFTYFTCKTITLKSTNSN